MVNNTYQICFFWLTHIVLSDKDKLILCLPKGSGMSFCLTSLSSRALLRPDNHKLSMDLVFLKLGLHNAVFVPSFVAGDQKCDMMLRKFVSRVAAGKGRAILEGLGLPAGTREMCFVNNPSNVEEAIQYGLLQWKNGQGYSPTWEVLLKAMAYAEVAVQDVEKLKEEILKGAYFNN